MHRHEQARQQRKKDAVQDVEAQQGMRPDFGATEQEGARVVDRVHAQNLVERTFMPKSGVARAMFDPTVTAQIES